MSEDIAAALDSQHREVAQLLHDTLLQSLSAASIYARIARTTIERHCPEALESAVTLEEVLRQASGELQGLVQWLRPPRQVEGDLVARLSELRELASLSVPCELVAESGMSAAPAIEAELLRLAQLALHHLVRHCNATALELELGVDEQGLLLTTRVIGGGVVAVDFMSLLNRRAQSFGGSFTSHHDAERGATLTCRLPLIMGDAEGRYGAHR